MSEPGINLVNVRVGVGYYQYLPSPNSRLERGHTEGTYTTFKVSVFKDWGGHLFSTILSIRISRDMGNLLWMKNGIAVKAVTS